MGGGLESRCVGLVYGADGAMRLAPDDGRMYPKHFELRIRQLNYLVVSSWHFTLFHEEDARSNNTQVFATFA